MPCFIRPKIVLKEIRERLKGPTSEEEWVAHVEKLVGESMNNKRTIQYDNFQKLNNNIEK